jgi:hypothetical protein
MQNPLGLITSPHISSRFTDAIKNNLFFLPFYFFSIRIQTTPLKMDDTCLFKINVLVIRELMNMR